MYLPKFSSKTHRNYFISLCTIALLVLTNIHSCNRASDLSDSIVYSQDTLRSYRDILDREYTVIKNLSGESEKDFLRIQTQDTTIKWLQESVKKYKGQLQSSLVLSNKTTLRGSGSTTITKVDTIFQNDSILLSPTYDLSWDGEWDRGTIKAMRDSIFYDIETRNEYEISIGKVSNGLFKKKTSVVEVMNLNPKTYTTELRSFTIEHEPKKIGIDIQIGYGFSSTLVPSPYIGIGVGYRLIGIK